MSGPIAGIILAAGTSSRLGQPKQLLQLEGRPLLQHAIDAMERSPLFEVIVVLGHQADEIAEELYAGDQTRVVVNEDYAQGQATSLKAGLEDVSPEAEAVLVILGDQPAVNAKKVKAVLEGYEMSKKPIVQASYRGVAGHPTVFYRSVWPELMEIEGDKGARDLIKEHPEWLSRVELGVEAPFDIDTPEDYQYLLEEWRWIKK